MADTDSAFDVRIVNPLERPLSRDFNLAQAAQRTTAQVLAGATFPISMRGNVFAPAEVGFAHFGFKASPLVTPGLAVRLQRGFGLAWGGYVGGQTNILDIPGLNISETADYYPMVMSQDKVIEVPPPPPAGRCRRDLIAVRRMTDNTIVLTDQQSTDVFNAANQVFTPTTKFKTMGFDYNLVQVFVTNPGGADYITPEPPLIYIPGVEYDYDNENTFHTLATTLRSTVPNGYRLIAAINVPPNATQITSDLICDFRSILFANNAVTLPLRFKGGSEEGTDSPIPGYTLEFDANDTRCPGIERISMVRIGSGSANLYSVVIPGLFGLRSATGIASLAEESPTPVNLYGFEVVVVNNYQVNLPNYNSLATAEQKAALANPALSEPTQIIAVGQPLTQIKFGLGCLNWEYHRVDYSAIVFGEDYFGDNLRTFHVAGSITLSY